MLRALEVTAVVRLTSLARGRLDIARLELTEPSLNLVRRANGRWNWEALLERTARTPLAPTAKPKSEARPGFPYIEASSGRINFKAGQEKKPYALLNADFALWQDIREHMGSAAESRTAAHRYEFKRHRPAANEWDMGARRNPQGNAAAIQRGVGPGATRTTDQAHIRKRQRVAGRGSVGRDVKRCSGGYADRGR